MSEWQDVPQDYRRQQQREALTTRMCLSPMGRSAVISTLTVSVPPDVAATLGWTIGTEMGLQLGAGRTAGWIRVAPAPRSGRRLRRVGNQPSLVVSLQAPEAWRHLRAPSSPAEYRIQGDALLAEIPWDMDNIEPPEAAAEEVA